MRTFRVIARLALAALAATISLPSATTVASADAGPAVLALAQTPPGCHPNYAGTCIPVDVPDADCAGTEDGPHFVQEKNIIVISADPFGLDPDKDGFGCDDPPDGPGTTAQGQPTTTAAPAPAPAPTTTSTTTTTAAPPADMPVTGVNLEREVVAALAMILLGVSLVVVGRSDSRFGMG